MGDKTFLMADKVHLNVKNFKSLLKFISTRNVDFAEPELNNLPIDAFGNYKDHHHVLTDQIILLGNMSAEELYELSIQGVCVFDICRAELLSFLICNESHWYDAPLPSEARSLFNRMFELNRDDLIGNMAAAWLWIEFWKKTTRSTPRLAYVGVFSGSLIYARSLLEIMRFHTGRSFVMESFFTGMHYYCEERYDPIANRSDIRHKTVFLSLQPQPDVSTYEAKRNAVRNLLLDIKNKNVTQPQATGVTLFDNDKSTLLVLGQVLNDFSLLESSKCGINSLNLYRELIHKILNETDWNIIFKAHPWERKKHNLNQPLTLNKLLIEFGKSDRVALVEEHALPDLFNEADAVVCINSQSGIEAALSGFKTIQLGDAFWGKNGFSHDISAENLDEVTSILGNPLSCRLDLNAFEQLEQWLVTVIDRWLVEETPSPKADARLKEIFFEISGRNPTNVSHPAAKAAKQPVILPAPSLAGSAVATPITVEAQKDAFRRKMRKLIRRPDDFFRDAKNDTFRRVGMFFFRK